MVWILADDDGFDVIEGGGVERVEDEVGRRVDRHLAERPLLSDEAAEVERVGLAQLPVQRLQPRLLHEQLLQLRGAPGRFGLGEAEVAARAGEGEVGVGAATLLRRERGGAGGGGEGGGGDDGGGCAGAEALGGAHEEVGDGFGGGGR